MNDVEGDSSNDSRYWAWRVMDTSRGAGYLPLAIFSYDQANPVLGSIQRSCTGAMAPCTVIFCTGNGCSVHQPPQHGGDVAQRHPCGRAL